MSVTGIRGLAGSWDVVVIGAGIAGTVAARELARLGLGVLLAERAAPGRSKVCGGCLAARAAEALDRAGLGAVPALAGGVPIGRAEVTDGTARLRVAIRPGLAVLRSALDAALAREAERAGATFRTGITATAGAATASAREVALASAEGVTTVRARVVVLAAGLAGGGTADRELGARTVRRSRIGLGAVVPAHGGPPPGTVRMAVSPRGYVGRVRTGQGTAIVAAAADPDLVRRQTPRGAVQALLRAAGEPVPEGLATVPVLATPRLTRRAARAAAGRLLAVGDASGYTEPFTGEGMTWAVETALAVVPIAAEAVRRWRPELAAAWTRLHRRRWRAGRRRSWRLALLLRVPVAVRAGLRVAAAAPAPVLRVLLPGVAA